MGEGGITGSCGAISSSAQLVGGGIVKSGVALLGLDFVFLSMHQDTKFLHFSLATFYHIKFVFQTEIEQPTSLYLENKNIHYHEEICGVRSNYKEK